MHKCIPYGEEWEEKPLPPGGAGRCGHCLPTDDNEGAKREIATGTVAVPDKIIGLTLILDFIDRGHSLCSLYLPQAAVASLPRNDNRSNAGRYKAQNTPEAYASGDSVTPAQ